MSIYAARLSATYNCAHFACDVWHAETGRDIRPILHGFLHVPGQRLAAPRDRHAFKRIPAPVEPCLVLLRRAKHAPHVGVFVRGRVFHLADTGPIRQPLHTLRLGYTSERYYAPSKDH